MLQPFKNFLTYLQKSANSSTLFGLTSNMNEINNQTDQPVETLPAYTSTAKITKPTVEELFVPPLKSLHDQNENEVNKSKTDDYSVVDKNVLEDDSQNEVSKRKMKPEKERIILDPEPANKKPELDPEKEIPLGIKDEEPAETDIEASNDSFSVNEILLEEVEEHNTSLNDPGSDPLAIEDYQADMSNNNSLLGNLPSSVDLDTSTEDPEQDIIVIIDVGEIKDNDSLTKENRSSFDDTGTTSEGDRDEHREELYEAPRLPLEDISEEQEIRSDGSDSGLGSETSGLQATINHSVSLCKFPSRSNLKRRAEGIIAVSEKKVKRSIHFDEVKVYYFPRMQGFACVPSQGGCTLGMGAKHTHFKSFTIAEHAAEQRRMHKQQMQEINPRGSSSEETDSDEELSEASGSDLDADASGFLQPVPARQRRAILKAAGIRKIDSTEKDECRAIRSSREFCGCSCRGYCDPDTCSCSQAGIKCQVDRPSFPCGCTRDGCANVVGRIEFNPNRVRTHFIHTIMRLELENKEKTSVEINTPGSSSLSYGNNCASNNGAISVTATNNCSSNASSLSNICSYPLSNIDHARTPHYGQIQMAQHNQDYISSAHNHNTLYPNMLQNGLITENCDLPQIRQHHAQIVDNGCDGIMNVVPGEINGSPNVSGHTNQQMNIAYNSFRDISTDSMSSSRTDSANGNMLIDYQSDNNQLYNGSYNSQSFLNQSYNNPLLNTNANYHCSVPSYSNYQQHYIAYASSHSCTNDSMEIHDLTSTDDEASSYISLHPPSANSSRFDAINDLLQNNRNTLPTVPSITLDITEPLPMKPITVSSTDQPTTLPSPAHTSIKDGTSITISPIKDKLVSQLSTPAKVPQFVDLTDDGVESNCCNDDIGVISWSQVSPSLQCECKVETSNDITKVNCIRIEHRLSGNANSQSEKNYFDELSRSRARGVDRKIEQKSQESEKLVNAENTELSLSNCVIVKEKYCSIEYSDSDQFIDTPEMIENSHLKTCSCNTNENVNIIDTALANDAKDTVDSVQDTVLSVKENLSSATASAQSISNKPLRTSPSHDVDENLTEIIKKSIVETVSA